jgi:peptidylprolyl isomerase
MSFAFFPHARWAPLAVTLAASLSCLVGTNLSRAAASTPAAEAIAQGGPVSLTASDIRALVVSLPQNERPQVIADGAALEKVVRAEVVSRGLLAEARSKGFDRQPDTLAQLDRVRDEALLRLWVAAQASVPAGYPSEEDVKAAYEANKASLVAPTQYRIGQVFISAPDGGDSIKLGTALRKAAEISTRIGSGADFSKLAHDHSEHAESAGKGGDMGFLPENQISPEILAAVRPLKTGEVVGPVKTSQGLHFLKLLDKTSGAPIALAEAHDRLAAALKSRKAGELAQAYLADLNARLGVNVNQIELDKLRTTLH